MRRNQLSAVQNPGFVIECLHELLEAGCVEAVEEQPHVCGPLSVVENSVEKKRLVVNLRRVNRFL